MKTLLEEKRNFRMSQSREKLDIARIMLGKGNYNQSILCSYLSLFYSVRVMLIGKDDDSDDYGRILELAEKFYEPSGWSDIDILSLMRSAKSAVDTIHADQRTATREEAENFHKSAACVFDKVIKLQKAG
jgi:uncharacterized protein (UPF0332 family)